MRPVTAVLIAVALLGAGGAAYTAKRVIENRAAQAVARQQEARLDIPVLVAARTLPPGHMLTDADLRWDPWPKGTADAAAVVTRKPDKPTLDHLPGVALSRAVTAGEPIRPDMVFKPGKGSLMPGVLAPGMRAVGIKVSAESTASGFVLPGDRVDVILLVDAAKGGKGLPGGGRIAAETVLSDVRVVAVDQSLDADAAPVKAKGKNAKKKDKPNQAEGPDTVSMVGRTVAVEVTPEQAEKVLIANKLGDLFLSLRSMARGEGEQRATPYVTDLGTSEAVRAAQSGSAKVFRGGGKN